MNVEGGVHLAEPREPAEEPLSRTAPVLLGIVTGPIEVLARTSSWVSIRLKTMP